jgi:hypothetical protein
LVLFRMTDEERADVALFHVVQAETAGDHLLGAAAYDAAGWSFDAVFCGSDVEDTPRRTSRTVLRRHAVSPVGGVFTLSDGQGALRVGSLPEFGAEDVV